jgi:ABC-type nitrate/sulfonate/bicarbonate transport system substrate-binding protein
MRSNRLWLIGVLALYSWLALVCHSYAAFPSESLTIGYSSFSGHYVPLWIAIEDHLGKKYGLDLKAVYAGRARPQQLLMSGEMLFVVATGTGALTSHVLGVKDQIIVLTFVNRVLGGHRCQARDQKR